MRIRTIVLLLLAVILAGGTAYLARLYLAAQRTEAELKAAPVGLPKAARSVLVAKANIRRGQILVPADLVWQVWPEGPIDKSYVVLGGPQKPDTFAGWVARNPIAAGEPVTESRIVAPGSRGFLAAALRPGMRAITVPLSVTSGVAGFIFPGDDVDLLLTFSVPLRPGTQSKYPHKATETMMHHIRVIAIDQRLETKAGQVIPAHTATFEVTPKQSEAIALATQMGRISLILTSLASNEPEMQAADQPVTVAANLSSSDLARQPSPDSSPVVTPTYTLDSDLNPLLPKYVSGKDASEINRITIIRGSRKTTEGVTVTKAPDEAPEPADATPAPADATPETPK
jgi:pilus assembly protein CpaB